MAAGNVAAHSGVTIKFDGTPVSMTSEAMSQITGKYYRVTSATHRCFDPRVALVIQDNGVTVASANIEAIDFLNGIVKFASSYTPTTPITALSGKYVPFSSLGVSKSFSMRASRDKLDKTVFGNNFRRYILGLKDFEGEVGAFDFLDSSAGVETLETSFTSATVRLISAEIIHGDLP